MDGSLIRVSSGLFKPVVADKLRAGSLKVDFFVNVDILSFIFSHINVFDLKDFLGRLIDDCTESR